MMNTTDQVTLQVALRMAVEQYAMFSASFNDHILILEDLYFSEEHRRSEYFSLSCRVCTPFTPFLEYEQESARNRFTRLVRAFEETSRDVLTQFETESMELRRLFKQMMSEERLRWELSERRRQDELMEEQQLCRRELQAVIAKLKAETAMTYSELEAVRTLETTLVARSNEIAMLREQLNCAIRSHDADRRKLLADIESERENARKMFNEDREAIMSQVNEITHAMERSRVQHVEELRKCQEHSAKVIDDLRHRLNEQMAHADNLRTLYDEVAMKRSHESTCHAEERNKLLRALTDAEIRCETLKHSLHETEAENKLVQLDYENASETRKLAEIQLFKKRLSDVAAKVCSPKLSSESVSATLPHLGADGVLGRARSSSFSRTTSLTTPPPYRDGGGERSSLSHPRSISPSDTIQLASPSEAYKRLASLQRSSSSFH
jgi:hypothetical protein